jgi:hypothetical protein
LEGQRRKRYQASFQSFRLQIDYPEPQTFLTRYRRDPFQSCARAISCMEDELIDHCKSSMELSTWACRTLSSSSRSASNKDQLIYSRCHMRCR